MQLCRAFLRKYCWGIVLKQGSPFLSNIFSKYCISKHTTNYKPQYNFCLTAIIKYCSCSPENTVGSNTRKPIAIVRNLFAPHLEQDRHHFRHELHETIPLHVVLRLPRKSSPIGAISVYYPYPHSGVGRHRELTGSLPEAATRAMVC